MITFFNMVPDQVEFMDLSLIATYIQKEYFTCLAHKKNQVCMQGDAWKR